MDHVARWLCQMQLTDDRFLRATPVLRVVEFAGRILRREHPDCFSHSQPVKEVKKFISHSWQASAWSKTFTLLYYYNWKPAVIVSNMLGALMMALFTLGLLPGFVKKARWETDQRNVGPWCLTVGIVSFLLVLVFHPPRELVFLDKICIKQTDKKEKMLGVLNLGACLKHSRKLLVLWERTYSERLLRPSKIHYFSGVVLLCRFGVFMFVEVATFITALNNHDHNDIDHEDKDEDKDKRA